MGAHRHDRLVKVRTMGVAVSLVMSCLAWGLPTSAHASSGPVIESESVSSVTEHDATLEAQIDTYDEYTGYWFQIDTNGSYDFTRPACPFEFPGDFECDSIVGGEPLAPGLAEPQPQYMPASSTAQAVSLNLASIGATLQPDTTYHYRVIVANGEGGRETGPDQTFTTPGAGTVESAPDEVVTEPTEATLTGYKLTGKLNPGGLPTTYDFEYIGDNEVECLGVESCWRQTAHMGPITGDTEQRVTPIEVTGLTSGETYRYRLAASNADGTVSGNVGRFTVGSPPSIVSESVSHITERDATLEAQIDTEGLETSYQFHLWAICGGRGICQVAVNYPLPNGNLRGSFVDQSVSLDLNSASVTLQPGGQYFYSVTATSAGGTAGASEGGRSFVTLEPVVQSLNAGLSLFSGGEQSPAPSDGNQPAGSGGSSSSVAPSVGVLDARTGKASELKLLKGAHKLVKALKACAKKPKKQRAACKKLVRDKFGQVASKARKR